MRIFVLLPLPYSMSKQLGPSSVTTSAIRSCMMLCSVRGPNMRQGGGARATAQDALVAHEVPTVFPDTPGTSLEVRIGRVGALSPFPHVAIHLRECPTGGGNVE